MKNYVDSQDLAYNTSNNNYIVIHNGTMAAYVNAKVTAGTYNDAWINQTIYNTTQVNAINTSHANNYVDTSKILSSN